MMFPMSLGNPVAAAQWERKPEPISQAGLHLFAHHAMACHWSIRVPDQEHSGFDLDYATQAVEAAWEEVNRLESELSRFQSTSDVGQINAGAGSGEWVSIGASAWECLSWALDVAAETGGAFDVALGAVLEERRRDDGTFDAGEVEAWDGPPMNALELAADPLRARLVDARARLDLGAIGKGYAIDAAASTLHEWGIESALLHAGQSSVLAMGDAPATDGASTSGGWAVNLRAPWESEAALGAVILKDAAMGGSGTSVQGYHILDPRTGAGARGWAASWVACPGFAALADALSTAFMVLDAEEIRAFCSGRPQISALAWREGEALAVGPLFENLQLEEAR